MIQQKMNTLARKSQKHLGFTLGEDFMTIYDWPLKKLAWSIYTKKYFPLI